MIQMSKPQTYRCVGPLNIYRCDVYLKKKRKYGVGIFREVRLKVDSEIKGLGKHETAIFRGYVVE